MVNMREMLRRANSAEAKSPLSGAQVLELFKEADSDGNGFLSYDEMATVLAKLLEACGENGAEQAGEKDLQAFASHMDLTQTGQINLLEFVAAFGLPESDYTIDRSSYTEAGEPSATATATAMMDEICSSLYQKTRLLQKTFVYLDVSGTVCEWQQQRQQRVPHIAHTSRPDLLPLSALPPSFPHHLPATPAYPAPLVPPHSRFTGLHRNRRFSLRHSPRRPQPHNRASRLTRCDGEHVELEQWQGAT